MDAIVDAIIAFGLWCGEVELTQRLFAITQAWLLFAIILRYLARRRDRRVNSGMIAR